MSSRGWVAPTMIATANVAGDSNVDIMFGSDSSPVHSSTGYVGAFEQLRRVMQAGHALLLAHRPQTTNFAPARHVRLHRHLLHYAHKKVKIRCRRLLRAPPSLTTSIA